jgi:hypothetical protein
LERLAKENFYSLLGLLEKSIILLTPGHRPLASCPGFVEIASGAGGFVNLFKTQTHKKTQQF